MSWITTAEVVQRYPLTRSHVYELIQSDWASFTARIGRKLLINAEALEAWLLQRGRAIEAAKCIKPPPRPGVYAIATHDGYVKIGRASDMEARFNGLQSAHPRPLRFLAALSHDPEDEAAEHARWERLRVRGEWFLASRELLQYAEQRATAGATASAAFATPGRDSTDDCQEKIE